MQIPVAPSPISSMDSFRHKNLAFVQNGNHFYRPELSSGLCTLPPGSTQNYLTWAKQTLHQAQQTPTSDLVSDIYYLLICKPDLNVESKFLEDLSDVAASVAHTMNPSQVTLVFETFMRLKFIHVGLLESFAESMTRSGDISSFPTIDVCAILFALSRLHRQKKNSGKRQAVNSYTLFPSEEKFISLLVDEVMDSRLQKLDRNDISRILLALAVLGVAKGAAIQKLTRLIESRRNLQGFTNKELSNMIYSIALMETSDRFTVEILSQELVSEHRMSTLLPGDVSMTIYSLGRLGYRHLNTTVDKLSSLLLPNFIKVLKSKELASIVYAFGELQYRHKQAFETVLKEILQHNRLRSLGGCEIVSILNGMAKLLYQNEVVVRAVCKISLSRIDMFDTKELCAVANALGKLKYKYSTLLKAIVVKIAEPEHSNRIGIGDISILIHSLGSLNYRDLSMLKALLQKWTLAENLQQFSDQGLTLLMHGFAMCNVKDSSILRNLVNEIVSSERLPNMSTLCLSCCVFSLAQLDEKNKRVLGTLGLELIRNDRRATISRRQMAVFIYSFGKLGFNHISVITFLKLALDPKVLPSFTDQDLANMLYGLALLGCNAFDAPVHFASEMLRREKAGKLHERRVSLCIYCLGKLGVRNYAVVDALLTSAVKKGAIKLLDTSGLLQIFIGTSWVGYNNTSVIQCLVDEVIQRQKASKLRNFEISKLVHALGILCVNEESGVVPLLSLILSSETVKNFTKRDVERMHDAIQFMRISRKSEFLDVLMGKAKEHLEQGGSYRQIPHTA